MGNGNDGTGPRDEDRPLRLLEEHEVKPLRLGTPLAPVRSTPTPGGTDRRAEGRWTGAELRAVREARGLTVAQLAVRTRVAREHVENVEQDRYPQLPPPVYLRGVLLAIAAELRLDGRKVARSYIDRVAESLGRGPAR